MIDNKISEAKKVSRKDLILQNRKKSKKADGKARLIFTHNRGNPPLHQWMREAKKCLVRNEKAKNIGQSIQISFKQPRNMKRLATQKKGGSSLGGGGQTEKGCFRCSKCHACPVIREGGNFTSTNTKRIYPINQRLDCNSSFVVYLATCRRCRGQYVGKTSNTFKKRHSGHKQEIKNQIGGLGGHYGGNGGCGYKNISLQIIDQVEQGDHNGLAERETYWQHQLRCYVENGGNAHCRRKEI